MIERIALYALLLFLFHRVVDALAPRTQKPRTSWVLHAAFPPPRPLSRDLPESERYKEGPPLPPSLLPSNESQSRGAYDALFSKLTFGYEKSPRSRTVAAQQKQEQQRTPKKAAMAAAALCYPSAVRPRGCEPLMAPSSGAPAPPPLPCVADGQCPYIQFRCAKGHTWKAVPGSPVCFHCPECRTSSSRVYGKKKGVDTVARVAKALVQYVEREHGGRLLLDQMGGTGTEKIEEEGEGEEAAAAGARTLARWIERTPHKWLAPIAVRCDRGHAWTATAGNLLRTWCPTCAQARRTLDEGQLHETAAVFGGRFLGFVDGDGDDDGDDGPPALPLQKRGAPRLSRHFASKLRWQCSAGHVFQEYLGNIRRKEGSKRKCSWCKECRAQGKTFHWRPLEQLPAPGVSSSA